MVSLEPPRKVWAWLGWGCDGFWGLSKSENGSGWFPETHHLGADFDHVKIQVGQFCFSPIRILRVFQLAVSLEPTRTGLVFNHPQSYPQTGPEIACSSCLSLCSASAQLRRSARPSSDTCGLDAVPQGNSAPVWGTLQTRGEDTRDRTSN